MMSKSSLHLSEKSCLLPNGIRLAYIEAGKARKQADTLIFVHGLGSNSLVWKKILPRLGTYHHCLAIDLPGYHQSSKGNYPFSMSFFAENILLFIQKLQLQNPSLVGHSMGGQVAMTLALQVPLLFRKLILVAPAGFETFTKLHRSLLKALTRPALIKATPSSRIYQNFMVSFYQAPEDALLLVQERLNLLDSPSELEYYSHLIYQCVRGMLYEPVFGSLHELQMPTLIVFGKEDRLIPNRLFHPLSTTSDIAHQGHTRIPKSKLELISNCGHFVPFEVPDILANSILNFVN